MSADKDTALYQNSCLMMLGLVDRNHHHTKLEIEHKLKGYLDIQWLNNSDYFIAIMHGLSPDDVKFQHALAILEFLTYPVTLSNQSMSMFTRLILTVFNDETAWQLTDCETNETEKMIQLLIFNNRDEAQIQLENDGSLWTFELSDADNLKLQRLLCRTLSLQYVFK